jgi:hypothetical protein
VPVGSAVSTGLMGRVGVLTAEMCGTMIEAPLWTVGGR